MTLSKLSVAPSISRSVQEEEDALDVSFVVIPRPKIQFFDIVSAFWLLQSTLIFILSPFQWSIWHFKSTQGTPYFIIVSIAVCGWCLLYVTFEKRLHNWFFVFKCIFIQPIIGTITSIAHVCVISQFKNEECKKSLPLANFAFCIFSMISLIFTCCFFINVHNSPVEHNKRMGLFYFETRHASYHYFAFLVLILFCVNLQIYHFLGKSVYFIGIVATALIFTFFILIEPYEDVRVCQFVSGGLCVAVFCNCVGLVISYNEDVKIIFASPIFFCFGHQVVYFLKKWSLAFRFKKLRLSQPVDPNESDDIESPNSITVNTHLGLSRSFRGSKKLFNYFLNLMQADSIIVILDLSFNKLSEMDFFHLLGAVESHPFLTELILSNNNICMQNQKSWIFFPRNFFTKSKVCVLDLSKNPICDMGVMFLSDAMLQSERCSLLKLNLSFCLLTHQCARPLSKIIEEVQKTRIRTLLLQGNNISPIGTKPIAKVLYSNKKLHRLDLSWNQIGNVGAELLIRALKYNQTLEKLHVESNGISLDLSQEIMRLIYSKNCRKKLVYFVFSPSRIQHEMQNFNRVPGLFMAKIIQTYL